MGDFSTKYTKGRPTKYHMHNPETKKRFGIQQDNNTVIQHTVYYITLQENERLSLKYETHENIDDEVDEDDLYELDKMSLDEK